MTYKTLWSKQFIELCASVENWASRTTRVVDEIGEAAMLQRIEKEGKHTISCRSGCSACCDLAVTISLLEALSMLHHATDVDGATIREHSEIAERPDSSNRTWFAAHRPCVFLRDRMCSVYEARPMTCRMHYVTTPPELCEGENYVTKARRPPITKHAKAMEVVLRILSLPAVYGPMPVVLRVALDASESDDPRARLWEIARAEGMAELGQSAGKWLRYG